MLEFLAPVLVFGLVIFVHELGHFLAAKAVGVYAPRFSIGFGPTLWRRRRGETEYVLAALPLGGYVRMASRLDQETAFLEGGGEAGAARGKDDPSYDPNAMIPFGPKPVPENRWFESKPLPARLFILIAGVAMNVLLAFVVSISLAYSYGRPVVPTTVVGDVRAIPAAPGLAQLRVGDTIVAINDSAVRTWNDVVRRIRASRSDTLVIATRRGRFLVPVEDGEDARTRVVASIRFHIPPVIDSLVPGEPAQRAGLQKGDSVVAVEGVPVRSWQELVNGVTPAAGRDVVLEIARRGERLNIRVRPALAQVEDPITGRPRSAGRIGAGHREIVTEREPVALAEAVVAGWRATWFDAGRIVGVVKGLLTGGISLRQLGGPIAITQASVTAARGGLEQLFYLIGFLSINVAVLNLLPIPILDGGQILINVIESAKGSPFSLRTREYILRFDLLAIALLFALVMFNDIQAAATRLFQ
ncbi:MAG: RIP metalloprotease RseP [Gemmatimonadaceae bacterium]